MAKAKRQARAKFPAAVGLTAGDKGKDVQELQEFLERFGYLATAAGLVGGALLAVPAMMAKPGVFDDATRKALTHYQTFRGLPPSGELDDATVAEMSKLRCGNPDVRLASGSFGAFTTAGKWARTDLTYSYRERSRKLPDPDVRNAIRAAFDLWETVSPLKFTEGNTGAVDMEIRFVTGSHGDNNPFDGASQVLAHAFFPGGALGGDVHFDDAEDWSILFSQPGTDLVTVAAHEIGHALGLDHSNVRGALMYPEYSGPQRFLAQDDINGIQRLYGAR